MFTIWLYEEEQNDSNAIRIYIKTGLKSQPTCKESDKNIFANIARKMLRSHRNTSTDKKGLYRSLEIKAHKKKK